MENLINSYLEMVALDRDITVEDIKTRYGNDLFNRYVNNGKLGEYIDLFNSWKKELRDQGADQFIYKNFKTAYKKFGGHSFKDWLNSLKPYDGTFEFMPQNLEWESESFRAYTKYLGPNVPAGPYTNVF